VTGGRGGDVVEEGLEEGGGEDWVRLVYRL